VIDVREPSARILVLLVVLVASVSCGGPPLPSASRAGSDEAITADPSWMAGIDVGPGMLTKPWLPPWAGAATPPEIAERSNLRFCGVELAPQAADPVVRRCFRESVAAALDVEFARIETTTEGDPIATIYGFEPPAFVMLVDSTQDAFGVGAWTVVTCQGLVDDPMTVFRFDGCTEGRTFR